MQASPKRQYKMSNLPTFIWEPEPLLLDIDPVVDLSNAFPNLFLSSPALPHVHNTKGLNGPWAEQIYSQLPPQPIGLPSLLVYNHKVDPNAPLGSFENPYSSFNAPPLPQPHFDNPSSPNPVDNFGSSETTDIFESLEARPPTPPKRTHRRFSGDRQHYHGSPIQFESVPSASPPMPANLRRNAQPIPHTRHSSRRTSNFQLRPQPQGISTSYRPPPVHRYIRRVHFAPRNRPLSSPLPSPSSLARPFSASSSLPPSYSHSPSPLPLRHHSPPYSPPLPFYSSPSPPPSFSTSSTSYSIRSYEWPLCMLCASKPATMEDEEMEFCKACWEEATEAEGMMKRGRWWRDA